VPIKQVNRGLPKLNSVSLHGRTNNKYNTDFALGGCRSRFIRKISGISSTSCGSLTPQNARGKKRAMEQLQSLNEPLFPADTLTLENKASVARAKVHCFCFMTKLLLSDVQAHNVH